MNLVSRGIRNTFRNGVRTVGLIGILALVIGLSLTMLIARQAVDTKIASVKSSIGNTITVSPAGLRGFEGGGDPLTADQLAKIKATAHVTSVSGSLSDRLTTSDTNLVSSVTQGALGARFNQEGSTSGSGSTTAPTMPTGTGTGSTGGTARTFTPGITTIGTQDSVTVADAGTIVLSSGSQIDATGSADEALVGATLATKNNLTVGSTFTAYGKTVTVMGIISATNNTYVGNLIIMPLTTLQTLASEAGDVTSATVQVDSVDNTNTVVSSLQSTLGSAADVTSAESEAETAIKPLESIQTLSLYMLIAAAAAGAVVILFTMIMIVRERRREIGVMKAIGSRNATISLQFMVEAATLTIIAALIGIVISVFAAGPVTSSLVSNASSSTSTTTGQGGPASGNFGGRATRQVTALVGNVTNVATTINWTIALYGLLAALVIALIGTAIASWFVSNIKPAEAIRAE